jgi:hypothetical protein
MSTPDDKRAEKVEEREEISGRNAFDVHRQMVVFLFAATFAIIVVFAFFLWRFYVAYTVSGDPSAAGFEVTPLMVVALAGVLGGFISALRRLYAFAPVFPSTSFSFWSRRSTAYVLMYSAIPPLVGAIAAVVVYLIFAGGMLQGPLFPAFDFDPRPGHPKDHTFANFLTNWKPKETVDFAKAFVWAFIAGFSEKFVPDILNRLGQSAQKPDEDA